MGALRFRMTDAAGGIVKPRRGQHKRRMFLSDPALESHFGGAFHCPDRPQMAR
jgi:hypothetical protein